MNTDDIIALVGDLGFPIFVAGYLLIRTDKMMRKLLSAIEALTLEIHSGSHTQ